MIIKLLNGIELYYEKMGQGDPLFLLHGNGDSHDDLKKLGQTLAEDFTVYLIDSRGHGKSSHHDQYFLYEDLADDLALFMEQLKLNHVNIIGHSDGAITAAMLAMRKNPNLNKIILLGITTKPNHMKRKWTKWIQDEYKKHGHPLFRLMVEEPQIEFEQLGSINIPTLVVAAEDDVMELETYIQVANHIPNGELYIVENEDHMSYVVDTDKFAVKAKEFLF